MSHATALMSAEEIDRALARIAHQVLEGASGPGELALVGIHTRGAPLARRLARKIAQTGEAPPSVGILDINLYRDDLSRAGDHPIVRRTEIPFKVAERDIVLVDDVLFTGRTIRAALDALIDLGRPRAIRLAVLVDRGGRELPIQPDFCGRTFTVQPDQTVLVRLTEIDGGEDRVLLCREREVTAKGKTAVRAAAGAGRGGAGQTSSARPPAPPPARQRGRRPERRGGRKRAGR